MTEETEIQAPVQKYATFNEDGFPTAFYSDDLHGDTIPDSAVAISDDEWLDMLKNQGLRKLDGDKIVACEPPELSAEQREKMIDSRIQADMVREADPLFFKAEAGEIKREVWIAKRQEIKKRHKN